MRKEYSKPALFAESFMMTEHISGACVDSGAQNQRHLQTRFKNGGDCAYSIYDSDGNIFKTFFLDDNTQCVEHVLDDTDPMDCYQVSVSVFNPFSS